MKKQLSVGQPKEQQKCVTLWKYRKESTMVPDKPWWVIYGENGFIAPVMLEKDAINLCAAYNASLGQDNFLWLRGCYDHLKRVYDQNRKALFRAREIILIWHGEVAWPEYQHSPEMKEINAALNLSPDLLDPSDTTRETKASGASLGDEQKEQV